MGDIVLIGSSIFEQWYNYALAFPGRTVKNLAVGGTGTQDWQEKILLPLLQKENPRALIVYVGSNDILMRGEDWIEGNLVSLRETAYSFSREMQFAYFSIIKAPGKREFWDKIERINRFFQSNLREGDLFYNTDRVFFDGTGLRSDFFLDDQTHHPRKAYDALVEDATPHLEKWLDHL